MGPPGAAQQRESKGKGRDVLHLLMVCASLPQVVYLYIS